MAADTKGDRPIDTLKKQNEQEKPPEAKSQEVELRLPWGHWPILVWLIGLHAAILFIPTSMIEHSHETLFHLTIFGRITQAGMLGLWVAVGRGKRLVRLGLSMLAACLMIALESTLGLMGPGGSEAVLYLLFFASALTGGAVAGVLGGRIFRTNPQPLFRRPQFSIVDLGIMTLMAAGVFTSIHWIELEWWFVLIDFAQVLFLALFALFQGFYVGLVCWPAIVPKEFRLARISGLLLGAVIHLVIVETVVYALVMWYSGADLSIGDLMPYFILFVLGAKLAMAAIAVATYLPLRRLTPIANITWLSDGADKVVDEA